MTNFPQKAGAQWRPSSLSSPNQRKWFPIPIITTIRSDEIDFVAHDRFVGELNGDVNHIAKSVLASAMINANYGQAGDHLAYGNPSGLALLE